MFSIRLRIVLASTLVFSVILIITLYISLIDINNVEHKTIDQHLRSQSDILTYQLQNRYTDTLAFRRILNMLNKDYGAAIMVLFSENGKIIPSDSLTVKNGFSKIQWDEKFKDISVCSDVMIDGKEFRCYCSKVKFNESGNAILVLAISTNLLVHKHHAHYFFFFTLVPVFLLIISYVSYRLTKSAFKPVMVMIDEVKEITANKLDKRLELPKSRDEIRTLGETLNEMISRIDNAFKSQKRFVADASHEIRTPLTIIQTELELAEQNTKEPETRESIKISLFEIERLNSLTNSLLTLAKLDAESNPLYLASCRVDELLLDCISLMQKSASGKNIIIKPLFSDCVEANLDSEKFRRAILNLIDNAVKFSENGKQIYISLSKSGTYFEIEIKDNGIGIRKDELPHIFKRFYRSNETRAKVSGSGIGLSLANEIVKIHGGVIIIESKLNIGTSALIRMPLTSSCA